MKSKARINITILLVLSFLCVSNNIAIATETGYVSVAAGHSHTIALNQDGSVCSWGHNNFGQLGDGSKLAKTVPVPIKNLSDVIQVSCGNAHTLAVTKDGSLWAWGANDLGQLGDGTFIDRLTPTKITTLSGVVTVDGGYCYSMALTKDGSVWAWGYNEYGQLGDGTAESKNKPTMVKGLSDVKAIASGGAHGGGSWHSLALKNDGTVWAWGDNDEGQLGNPSVPHSTVPIQVLNLTNVVDIDAGGGYCVALKDDGTVWTWGTDWDGQLGYATDKDSSIPQMVDGLNNVVSIATGEGFTVYAIKKDGTLWTWGRPNENELDMDNYYKNINFTPVKVNEITDVKSIAVGIGHTVAIKTDGTVWAWGLNQGRLGDGTVTLRKYKPVKTLNAGVLPTVHMKLRLNNNIVYYMKGWYQLPGSPYVSNGRTMVPVRFISEELGTKVSWIPKDQKIVVSGDKEIQFWIGKNYAVINGISYDLEVPPEIKNGMTFIPLRFISEEFGAQVVFNGDEQTIDIVR